jgi:thioredoxin 2
MATTTSPDTGSTQRTKHITIRCQFCQTWNRVDASKAGNRPKCGKCTKPMLLDRPVTLDDESFARTIQETEIPVFVDFYADWCGPCKMMAPYVDQMATKYMGRVLVAKLNTDVAQKTSMQFQIRGIPTSMVFEDGKPVAEQSGAMPLAGLEKLLAKAGVT